MIKFAASAEVVMVLQSPRVLVLFGLSVMAFVTPAKCEEVLIDDFDSGELFLPLQEGVRFDSFTQTAQLGPIVRGGREWSGVWSSIREEGQSAAVAVDTSDGVFRVDTPGDPFTYYTLSYSLFGGFQQSQPIPYDAVAAGMDRVRLRFAGNAARVFHSVIFESEANNLAITEGRGFGSRFVSIPGGIVEIPFEEIPVDQDFFRSLTGFSLTSSRYQGDFELDSIELAGTPMEGDINRDGVVDGGDRDFLMASFNGIRNNDEPIAFAIPTYHTADMNGDGQINAADYTLWRDAFDALSIDQANSVPEPSAFVLVLVTMMTPPRHVIRR